MLSIFRRDVSDRSVKLNDRGFGRLDTLISDNDAAGGTSDHLRDKIALVFDLKTKRELDRFCRVNLND